MNIRKLLLGLATVLFALTAQAQDVTQTQTSAKLKAVAGDVTVKIPGGSAVMATVGMTLPQGSEIVSGANSQATVELHDGIVAVVGQNSSADLEQLSIDAQGKRTGLVNLKSGTIASSLDPKKKAINNYAVKTPKGVAAARGTTYSVSYNGATYSCTVVAGVVSSMTVTQFTTISHDFSARLEALGAEDRTQVLPGRVVASSDGGQGNQMSIAEALEGGVSGFSRTAGNSNSVTQTVEQKAISAADAANGLALLAAAVASVSNNVADVAAVVQTIASSAGSSQAATNAVAAAAGAAAATAATNSNLNGGTTGTASTAAATTVAQQIVQAAVQGSVQAGNSNAAATIVATTTVAVATATNTTNAAATSAVSSLAAALTQTSNSVSGATQVNATQVTTAVEQVTSNPNTAVGTATQTTTPVSTTPTPAPGTPSTPSTTPTTTETPVITTPQPIDPTTVSRSGE